MKVTVLKNVRNKEVINRIDLEELAGIIRDGVVAKGVRNLREVYHLMQTERLEDGQVSTNWVGGIKLPRVCFAADYENKNQQRRMLAYNGLVVIELNGLKTYEEAVALRNQTKRLPQTMMAFLGASGKSVKIVCRGELYPDLAENAVKLEGADMLQFHLNLYMTALKAYQTQFNLDIACLEPRLDRTVYLSADPEMYYNPEAAPFYADTQKSDEIVPLNISEESDSLMPGRTLERSYHMNWLFIVENTLGHYFDLPDDQRQQELLMMIATRCLNEKIPLAHAQGMTMLHPVFCNDRLLVEKTFQTVYAVTLQEEWMKKHKFKPLKSIPNDTIQMMKTEIFLNSNYDMRKNLMTGVAEYREKFSSDQNFKPLTEEVRNDMTMRATQLGLKSWDRDVNRFIDSTRIEQYDPVNTWLDKLPHWDGHDYIKELAARVPTSQPHWEMYLRMWLVGMVAQWTESDKQLTGNALTPLLIGRQGCGKTCFCKILLTRELREYYNDKLNFKNEFDLNIALTSFALINIDEFDKTSGGQQIVLKYLLSSSDVKFRPPYGKTIKQYRRYTSFIGTTNQQQPLVDPTGSRRFVCVGVTGNIDFTDNLNHRQLFAQALHLFNSGERFWLNDEEIATLIRENEPYQKLNDLVEMVGETFRSPKPGEDWKWWGLSEVSNLLASRYENFDIDTSFSKLGSALNNHQFEFESRRVSKRTEYKLVERE